MCGFRVSGVRVSRFRVSGLWGLGFLGLGFLGIGFLGLAVWGLWARVSGFGVSDSVQNPPFVGAGVATAIFVTERHTNNKQTPHTQMQLTQKPSRQTDNHTASPTPPSP